MSREEVLKLIDAGFTKADIEAMETGTEGKEEIKEEPAPAEEVKPVKEVKPADNSDLIKALAELNQGINELRQDMQKRSLLEDDSPIKNPIAEGEKVLASIIDPPAPKKKGKDK